MAVIDKKNVYQIVTDRFIEQLKNGVVPWEKPWVSIQGSRVGGWGHKTGKSYSLLNQMMLPKSGEYITFQQIKEEGGKLKKGSKGYPICFWKSYKSTVKDTDTNVEEEIEIPVLRYYTVFSIEDCEGITQKYKEDTSELDRLKEPERCKRADSMIKEYINRTGIELEFKAQDEAYYSPLNDKIVMPLKKQFKKKAEYYSTLFHETVHSTGNKERLNRFGTSADRASKASYSLEELVAEIGASSLNYLYGIETKSSVQNSSSYVNSWLKALGNDDRMIVKAASRAQKAVNYILPPLEEADTEAPF